MESIKFKPEPLKDKEKAIIGCINNVYKGIKTPCFTKQDILSAVEWLKYKIGHITIIDTDDKLRQKTASYFIDKAFEDVIKK